MKDTNKIKFLNYLQYTIAIIFLVLILIKSSLIIGDNYLKILFLIFFFVYVAETIKIIIKSKQNKLELKENIIRIFYLF